MADIPRALLDEYTAQLNALSEASQKLVLNALKNAEWDTVDQLRNIMVAVMEQVCFDAADAARVIASDMYDDIRYVAIGKRLGYNPPLQYDPNAIVGSVKALVQSVVDTGGTKRFGEELAARVDYEVKLAANRTAATFSRMDPLKPKFARVPDGSETCGWCVMLASRGYDYHSAETASHSHTNCDCRIVQQYGSETVEGYDVARYEKVYADNAVYDDYGHLNTSKTIYAMEKQLKLEHAIAENIDYSEVPRSAFGVQRKINAYEPEDFLKKGREWRDLFAQDTLALKGYKVAPRAPTAPDGYSNIDAWVNGKLVEFKSPEAPKLPPRPGNELDFIDRNLHKAVGQFMSQYDPSTDEALDYTGPITVVLNLKYRPVGTNEAKKAIKRSMKTRGVDEVYLVTPKGRVLTIK